MSRGEKYRSAERDVARIDGDRAARGERHAERAHRAARGIGEGQFAKKYEARILVEKFLQALRIRRRPGLDRLHRGLLELELSALDEVAPDRLKRVAVLVGVAEAQRLAAVELHAAGTLDMEEERFDRIVDPEDFLARDGRRASSDFRARVVRHDALSLHAPAQAQAPQLRADRGEIDGEQVIRRTIKRVEVRRRPGAAAAQKRLVVTRDHPLDRAVGVGETPGNEMLFEEAPRLVVAGRAQLHRPRANAAPALAPAQRLAGCAQGVPGGGLLAVLPAGQ